MDGVSRRPQPGAMPPSPRSHDRSVGSAPADPSTLMRSPDGFATILPGTLAVRIGVGDAGRLWQRSSDAALPLLVGSAVKTFILAAYLQAVEQGERRMARMSAGPTSRTSPPGGHPAYPALPSTRSS